MEGPSTGVSISRKVKLTTSLPYSNWYYESPPPTECFDDMLQLVVPHEVTSTGQQPEVTVHELRLDSAVVSFEHTIKINLPEGGTHHIEFEWVEKPGYKSWYLPEGPCPTPSQVYNGIMQTITSVQRNGWWRLLWSASREDFYIGVSGVLPRWASTYLLSRPNSPIDLTCADRITRQVESAFILSTRRLLERTVKEMIRRNCEGSKWITKSEDSECSVNHSEGNLFGCLPCRHRACMNCMIDLTLKISEDCICPECEGPFMIWPFDFGFKTKYSPSTTSTEISQY